MRAPGPSPPGGARPEPHQASGRAFRGEERGVAMLAGPVPEPVGARRCPGGRWRQGGPRAPVRPMLLSRQSGTRVRERAAGRGEVRHPAAAPAQRGAPPEHRHAEKAPDARGARRRRLVAVLCRRLRVPGRVGTPVFPGARPDEPRARQWTALQARHFRWPVAGPAIARAPPAQTERAPWAAGAARSRGRGRSGCPDSQP